MVTRLDLLMLVAVILFSSSVYSLKTSPRSPPLRRSPGDMLDLLKWRAHPERINDSLSKLKEIDGSEIVKVRPPPISWLFSVLQSTRMSTPGGDRMEGLI